MNRRNAFTIEISNTSNLALGLLLSNSKCEASIGEQPELKLWDVFWFENPPKELFKFADHFNWLSGPSRLWLNEKPFKQVDFKTNVGTEEQPIYEYINWELLSDVAPIIEEDNL